MYTTVVASLRWQIKICISKGQVYYNLFLANQSTDDYYSHVSLLIILFSLERNAILAKQTTEREITFRYVNGFSQLLPTK